MFHLFNNQKRKYDFITSIIGIKRQKIKKIFIEMINILHFN